MGNALQDVKRFLDTLCYREKGGGGLDLHKGALPFVTLSRQTGAGGHSLAEELLRQMENEKESPLLRGWQIFDQELCKKLLEDPTLKVSMRSLLTEEYHSQIEEIMLDLLGYETPQEVVLKKMFQAIRTLATFGKVILVGRAGSCATRGLPMGIHVRLVASEGSRIKRMVALFRLSEKEAAQMVHKQDSDRARLVRDYFNRLIDDPLLYDAVWNTDSASLEEIAASLIPLIRRRAEKRKAVSLER